MSLFERVAGIVRRPRATFESVVAMPQSTGFLVMLFLVPFALSAGFYATETGQQALVDQWERTTIAFGQPVDDARYAQFQELSQQGVPYAALTALVTGPAAAIGLAAALYVAFSKLRHGRASFPQVLAVVAHAGVILILRQVVAAPANYMRETTASPTTLTLLFRGLDEASLFARFFGAIDLFLLWWLMVLAVGLGVLYRQQVSRIALLLLGVYITVAAALAGVMAVTGGVS